MGIYLNPGKQRFQIAMNSEIFVDKTEMIRCINSVVNTNQRYISVSRPRRFGKTMAADTLCAYYDRTADSRSLFEKTQLPRCDETKVDGGKMPWYHYLGNFDVIRLVITDEDTGEVFIPNKEILDVFKSSTKSSEWTDTFKAFATSPGTL